MGRRRRSAGGGFNRSNDFILGLTYTNIVQFTTLQEVLASALGVDIGPYTHISTSLHLYEDDPIAARLLARPADPVDLYMWVTPQPMAAWDDDGWTELRALVEIGTRPVSPIADGWLAGVSCPYWNSVARMLRAWHWLKVPELRPHEALLHALDELDHPTMVAQDWRLAALEYLWRWSSRRGVGELVYQYSKGQGWPDAALAWILHDDLR
mgnify:FL=1